LRGKVLGIWLKETSLKPEVSFFARIPYLKELQELKLNIDYLF